MVAVRRRCSVLVAGFLGASLLASGVPVAAGVPGVAPAAAVEPAVDAEQVRSQLVAGVGGLPPDDIWESQLKLLQRAGTGTPVGSVAPGQAGYRERVNFGDQIGTYIARDGSSSPTSVGVLHYRADGSVHIIPARSQ